jgi:hypothetical protein
VCVPSEQDHTPQGDGELPGDEHDEVELRRPGRTLGSQPELWHRILAPCVQCRRRSPVVDRGHVKDTGSMLSVGAVPGATRRFGIEFAFQARGKASGLSRNGLLVRYLSSERNAP